MNRNKKILGIIAIIFLLIVFGVTYDMMRRTTPPWEKRMETLDKYDKDWKK